MQKISDEGPKTGGLEGKQTQSHHIEDNSDKNVLIIKVVAMLEFGTN